MVELWRRLVDFVEYPSLGLNQLSLIRLVNSSSGDYPNPCTPQLITAIRSLYSGIVVLNAFDSYWDDVVFASETYSTGAHAEWKSISQHHRCCCSRFLVYSPVNITSSSINHYTSAHHFRWCFKPQGSQFVAMIHSRQWLSKTSQFWGTPFVGALLQRRIPATALLCSTSTSNFWICSIKSWTTEPSAKLPQGQQKPWKKGLLGSSHRSVQWLTATG